MDKAEAKNILKHTGYIGNEVGVAFEVAIKSMDKLDKIEQIYRQWYEIGDDADCWAFREIGKILEQDN